MSVVMADLHCRTRIRIRTRIRQCKSAIRRARFVPFQTAKLAELGLKATFFDKIAAMSHQAFNALAATIPESMSGRKVLAAMIMKTSPSDEGSVISLGTGTCMVHTDHMLESVHTEHILGSVHTDHMLGSVHTDHVLGICEH